MTHDPQQDQRLTAYVLDELDDDQRRDVERICEQSAEARQLVSQLRRTAERVRGQLRDEPVPILTDGQRLEIERQLARPVRLFWPVGIAAVLALGGAAGIWIISHASELEDRRVVVGPAEPPAPPGESEIPPFVGTVPPSDPLADLPVELPEPAHIGTPKQAPPNVRMAKLTGKDRGPYRLPRSIVSQLQNVALNKTVTSSDSAPLIGELQQITDGDKSYLHGRWVELAPGRQWVQVDLGQEYENFAILLWHRHNDNALVYRDVIVQVSDDPSFSDARTVFNNDYDRSSGLGEGRDYEYFENYEGLLVPLHDPMADRGVKFRYIRCWSRGSTSDDGNHYTEIEVWGRPAK